ncbi:MAG: hypothetical protein KBT44_02960 [Bacteroidales bacterium]|nr:hypothetical protein [Candidatus Equibacterium intestinale]
MKSLAKYIFVMLFSAAAATFTADAQNNGQSQAEPDYEKQIKQQVDYFIETYHLDDIQAFRLDTLLQHYLPIYNEEVDKLKSSGISMMESYQPMLDKWADFFDRSYEKIFTPEQWKRYLKSAAGKEKKKRDIRMAEAAAGSSKK